MVDDTYSLQRFVEAQERVYDDVCSELRAGAKSSHWTWFVFPQLKQLGRSSTARYFGIASLAEAMAYWQHPVLGGRLKECTELVLSVEGKTALRIFGSPDDMKFRSSMTLFELAALDETVFERALEKYYGGHRDPRTLELLR